MHEPQQGKDHGKWPEDQAQEETKFIMTYHNKLVFISPCKTVDNYGSFVRALSH